jgi:hypothetical protein
MNAGAIQVLEQGDELERSDPSIGPAGGEDQVTAAFELGWRVAELYAQVDDTGEPASDTLLPSHQSLEPDDQLELQLRAAAGDARRAGIGARAATLERLAPGARSAPDSRRAADDFRRDVRDCHIELSKDLWAREEAAGRAYELGNGMSDTYNRICRSYACADEDPSSAWEQTFARGRVERLKKLLDDLQSRLDSAGVAVVRNHLDLWRDNVPARLRAAGPPPLDRVRDGLRRQTVTWRQLLAGHKEPEAHLDSDARAELRDDLRKLVWGRCCRWLLPVGAALFLLVLFLPQVLDWYERSVVERWVASAFVAVAGAFGITKASMAVTVRTRADQWSELLWNRAVARKVSERTLLMDAVLPPPRAEARSLAALARGLGDRVARAIRSHRWPFVPARRQRAGT